MIRIKRNDVDDLDDDENIIVGINECVNASMCPLKITLLAMIPSQWNS